jgi:hypothetical protein
MRAAVIDVWNNGPLYDDLDEPLWITFNYPVRPFRYIKGCLSVDEAIRELEKASYKLIGEKDGMSLLQSPTEDNNMFYQPRKKDERAWVIPETHPAFNAYHFIYGTNMFGNRNTTKGKCSIVEEHLIKVELFKNFPNFK